MKAILFFSLMLLPFCALCQQDTLYALPDSLIKALRLRPYVNGKLYVRVIIETDGRVSEMELLNGDPDCPACTEEILGNLRQTWRPKPQLKDGVPVRREYLIPICINLK
jgi:hypothetical protein